MTCFPRIRGDVPGTSTPTVFNHGFSPHTRGCSPQRMASYHLRLVFPAYAGMFLYDKNISHFGQCFPRIRGDVP